MNHRPLAFFTLVLSGLGSGVANAQRSPGFATPPVTMPPRPPPIIIEKRHARTTVPLTGILDGPVAVDAHGHVILLADDGVLEQVASDGTLRWTFLAGPPGGEPAVGVDGTVYCVGRDGRLYAVSDEGYLVWSRRLGGRPVRGVAVGRLLVAVALDTGRIELWRTDGSPVASLALGGTPSGAAVVVGDQRVIVSLQSGQVVALDGLRLAWRARVGSAAVGSLAVDSAGALVAGDADGVVVKLNRDGALAWRARVGGPVTRSPALAEDGTAFFAAGAAVVALGADGVEAWRQLLRAPIAAGPVVADDGSVFVASAGGREGKLGEIRVFDEAGRNQRTIALPAAPTRSLTLAPGMLWVGLDDFTLRRISVPERSLAHSSWPKARGGLANAGAL